MKTTTRKSRPGVQKKGGGEGSFFKNKIGWEKLETKEKRFSVFKSVGGKEMLGNNFTGAFIDVRIVGGNG